MTFPVEKANKTAQFLVSCYAHVNYSLHTHFFYKMTRKRVTPSTPKRTTQANITRFATKKQDQ